MIDEDELRRLLAGAAESAPPPSRAAREVVVALRSRPTATTPARARRRPSAKVLAEVAAIVVVVVAIGATLTRGDAPQSFSTTGSAIGTPLSPRDENLRQGSEGDQSGQPLPPVDTSPDSPDPVDGARVIKTGSLDLEVRRGAFDATVERITSQTIGLGGYVAESTTSQSDDADRGTIIVRVPASSFDALLRDLQRLGEVESVTSKGTDVTAQFTDLEARLAALTATRSRLSAVLAEANNVGDILAVQDRITAVQVEIEKIQGQQRLLTDQTSFATLSVTVAEPGAEVIAAEADPDPGLGAAWDDARRRFGDGIEALVEWSGPAAVVAIVGLALLAVGRIARVGLRRRFI
jgi:hypothetical protein